MSKIYEIAIDTKAKGSSNAYSRWITRMLEIPAKSVLDGLENGIAIFEFVGTERAAFAFATHNQKDRDLPKLRIMQIHRGHDRYDFWEYTIVTNYPWADVDPPDEDED